MDKNQFIGITLIFLMVIVYLVFFSPEPVENPQISNSDTLKNTENTKNQKNDTNQVEKVEAKADSSTKKQEEKKVNIKGEWAKLTNGKSKLFTLENEQLKLIFNTKGGQIEKVILKKYTNQNDKPLVLFDAKYTSFRVQMPLPENKDVQLYDLFFDTKAPKSQVVKTGDTTQIKFIAKVSDKKYIEQIYTLGGTGFEVGYQIRMKGLGENSKETLYINWLAALQNTEPDIEQTRIKTTVNYYTAEGDFNYLGEASTDEDKETIDAPLHWVGFKQKFFTMALIASGNNLKEAEVSQKTPADDPNTLKIVNANLQVPIADLHNNKGNFTFYFGPNRYQTLRKVTEGFYKNVDLGWPVINLLTRFIIVPLFSFLEGFIANYGLIIIIMVLIIRGALFPLSYKSYVSMAKMKALKPELEELKEKVGDDAGKLQQEQMKLYQQVGINPLSGCVPILLQMPVLFAMFTFFPNAIELRQESFLWANDLSIYDSIANLPFEIPFYGDHVSLFTILMTLSTIGLTFFNNQNTPTTMQGGIDMKSIGYVMPVVFMFVLNSFPAGLSFYYLVSNLFGIGQQVIIRRFVDDSKIRDVLEKNKVKNKNKKKSPFMQRLEDAMKAQEDRNQKSKDKKSKKTK